MRWISTREAVPAQVIPGQKMVEHLELSGELEPEEQRDERYEKLLESIRATAVSKLVLTVSNDPVVSSLVPHYEIGFYTGHGFCNHKGYGIYPPPTHWCAFPEPPTAPIDTTEG
jgi:hypothetical protein